MPDVILSAVEYGGYISLVKFIIFLILFFLWLPLVPWVFWDARSIGTKDIFWTAVVFGAGAAAAIIWLLVPIFIAGMLLYLVATAATAGSYVMHRNAKVPDFDRILTSEHIKGLFVNEAKKLEVLKNFVFITANNNEVPMPAPKTAEFIGYKKTYDIFLDATWRRATNIAFAPNQKNYSTTYYIDGTAVKQPDIPRNQMDYLIHFLKNIADLNVEEKRKPQKGRFITRQDEQNTEWEVTTAGSTAGEQIQLKQLTKEAIIGLEDLGLMPKQLAQLKKVRDARQGLFLLGGPEKSGVTTTFYTLLKNHDAFLNSLTTLERKPSADLQNITQNVFTLSDTGTGSYAKKLKVMLRTEPDIVGVADCTDGETAKVACEASKDGKNIYVTLKADNVVKTLGKWIKMTGNKNLVAETLIGISNQRLLRKLCNDCKQAYEPNKELLKKFNISPDKAKVFYRSGKNRLDKRSKPITCENCQGTGFVGRTCIFEIIVIDEQLRKGIKQSKSLSEIATHFRRARMLYLQEQALKKVIEGTTSINEMVRILSANKKKVKRPPVKK